MTGGPARGGFGDGRGGDRRRAAPHEPIYRRSVGIALFNREGRVFLGRRRGTPELGDLPYAWQMPQGGIDPGEEPVEAAWRELHEETNVRSATLIGEAEEWLRYDLPAPVAGRAWKGRYRGQSQRWFAFRFEGEESEIDVLRPGEGRHRPEFSEWRWERLDRVAELIVPFKRDVYLRVAELFAPLARTEGEKGDGLSPRP